MVWIEISTACIANFSDSFRHPRGWWGLKFKVPSGTGETRLLSPPARVVWIEMETTDADGGSGIVATREGGVD